MKVLMMRPSYRPELSGGTHLAIDLVEDFVAAGHDIEVVVPVSAKFEALIDEKKDECIVHRVSSRFNRRDIATRICWYVDTSWKMYSIAKKIDAEIIMTHSMPPLLGPLGAILGKRKKIPVLFWEQDIVSQSLVSTGILGKKGIKQNFAFKIAEYLERKSEKHSTHIITISEQFKKMHLKRGISSGKVSVVYNWIDERQVYPVPREENPLYEELKIPKDKFIVTYCGNLGVPQNVEIMIDAAEMLKDNSDIVFVIIGGGSREKIVDDYILKKNLPNLIRCPMQPLEMAHYVYSIGDVGLVIGRTGTSNNGFPSKTWSIMAAGQAMVSCFDEGSELSQFVRDGKCGITCRPDDSKELKEAIVELYENRDLCENMGLNARKYVTEHFSRKTATDRIIKIAEALVSEWKDG